MVSFGAAPATVVAMAAAVIAHKGIQRVL